MKTLEEKIAVMQHYQNGGKILFNGEIWNREDQPLFNWYHNDYSIYEEPKEKPSVNWDHVGEKYNYFAFDADGDEFFYENKPTRQKYSSRWDAAENSMWARNNGLLSSLTLGNCDWKDSLICRPGFE